MAGEQSAVDSRDDSEEGDFSFVRAGAREVGRSEALPDRIGVEWEQELDGGAGQQGSEESVDSAMDVMEGEDVKKVVGG